MASCKNAINRIHHFFLGQRKKVAQSSVWTLKGIWYNTAPTPHVYKTRVAGPVRTARETHVSFNTEAGRGGLLPALLWSLPLLLFGVLADVTRQEKGIRSIKIGKEVSNCCR